MDEITACPISTALIQTESRVQTTNSNTWAYLMDEALSSGHGGEACYKKLFNGKAKRPPGNSGKLDITLDSYARLQCQVFAE